MAALSKILNGGVFQWFAEVGDLNRGDVSSQN